MLTQTLHLRKSSWRSKNEKLKPSGEAVLRAEIRDAWYSCNQNYSEFGMLDMCFRLTQNVFSFLTTVELWLSFPLRVNRYRWYMRYALTGMCSSSTPVWNMLTWPDESQPSIGLRAELTCWVIRIWDAWYSCNQNYSTPLNNFDCNYIKHPEFQLSGLLLLKLLALCWQ